MNKNIRFSGLLIGLILQVLLLSRTEAQYAPPAGQEGSTAISKDSSIILQWAMGCAVQRGWQNISDQSLGKTTVGDESMATGKAGNGVVSLGDGGMAVLSFENPVSNGPGFDFAVFENSFQDDFLELAFVEVSSDGLNFFRFPAVSLTDASTQVSSFGALNATKLNNLAGKYRGGYGTPFDLEELQNQPGLNINNVTHIRIIDVVGNVEDAYATYDSKGNKVNDPWPTAFASGGFDLDAVAVLNSTATGIDPANETSPLKVFPSLIQSGEIISVEIANVSHEAFLYQLINTSGTVVEEFVSTTEVSMMHTSAMASGIYLLKVTAGKSVLFSKISITQ